MITGADWRYGVCVKNDGYSSALRLRRLYQVVPDEHATRNQMVRVIDESGEDHLYPSGYVLPMVVSGETGRNVSVTA